MAKEILGKIDFPIEGSKINQLCLLEGYSFSTNDEEVIIIVRLDGKGIYKTKTGMPKYDAEQSFSEFEEKAYRSGFVANLDLTEFEDGKHDLMVLAKTSSSKRILTDIVITLKKELNQQTDIRFDNILNKGFKSSDKVTKKIIDLCNIKPNEKVLEIGCQYGRLATPFTEFLSSEGRFEGLDIIPNAILFCNNNIRSKFPNFNFTLANVYNKWYNSDGKTTASKFKFPYEDNFFDNVYLISVFTHMLPEDMTNYLKEISRVLKKNGRCLISYFLLNDDSIKFIETNKTKQKQFRFQFEGYRTVNKENPEAAIAYDEKFVRKLYDDCGFEIKMPILYGKWTGREVENTQDYVIGIKK